MLLLRLQQSFCSVFVPASAPPVGVYDAGMTTGVEGMPEGLADVGLGTALARAVEPAAGEASGHTHERACLNCGTALVGPHCHECGQRAHVHRTLSAFFHDLLHGVLHFEGKTWRTVPLLVWQPGRLTREYIDGKRARYVSPIALFLFVVFLSFALFNALGGGGETNVQGLDAARAAYEKNEATIDRLEREQASADAAGRAKIDEEIRSLEEDQQKMRSVFGQIGSDFTEGFSENPIPRNTRLGQAIDHIRENPQLAIYKAQTSAYKYSWMLIPLSVPFVWLLFPFNRRFRGYDHTVFVTYSITFMVALVAIGSLLSWLGFGEIGLLLLLYAPFHMYRQLRGTYGTGRFGAIWRMLALSLFAWMAIALFATLIAMMAGT